jgi:hypothetical protein
MHLVGIIGKKGSGKSECSKVLCEKYNFQRISFADKLKQTVSYLFDIPLNFLYDPKLKETYDDRWEKTYREIMQLFGTEVGRCIYDNIWIYHTEKQILQFSQMKFVIDDVRFKNEAKLIKNYNGLLLRIIRPTMKGEVDFHKSETEQDEIEVDTTILNNSSKEDLYNTVNQVYLEFCNK